VYVVEGEKDADRLHGEGLLATTNPSGAGKWKKEFGTYLEGRVVFVLPDNDLPGVRHAEEVARSLHAVARVVKVVQLPGLQKKGDVSDWLSLGHSVAELQELAQATKPWEPTIGTEDERRDETGSLFHQSKAARAIALICDSGVTFFHDERGEPYAAVPLEGGRRVLSLGSREFRDFVDRRFWDATRQALGREPLSAVLGIFAGQARYDGGRQDLGLRLAGGGAEIWIDLDGKSAIRVSRAGWDIVERPPILFRSFPMQRPLPVPVRGGDAAKILSFLNLRSVNDRLLLLCYLTAAFVPEIPIPCLVVHGVAGSAKTTFLKVVKRTIDPSAVDVHGGIRDLTEYAQAAWQNRALYFDNLSSLPDWLSDALCRTVTGEGWSKRKLYTDEDATVFEYRRLVGLSGINLVAERGDLLDRSLIIGLDPIGPDSRRSERAFWAEFESSRAGILGGLLDVLVLAMNMEPSLPEGPLPRMADFARWGMAVAQALGESPGDFLRAYAENVGRQNEAAIEESPVAQALAYFMTSENEWSGTPAQLLDRIQTLVPVLHIAEKCKAWPKTPGWLTRRIMEVHANLLSMGIRVDVDRQADARRLVIRRVRENAVTGDMTTSTAGRRGLSLAASADGDGTAVTADANRAGCRVAHDGNDGKFAPVADTGGSEEPYALPERQWDEYQERAAIMEFDANLPREEAERRAAELVRGEQSVGTV
jgi:hypothetical protein